VPETYDSEKSLERQIRAFHWVRLLAELPGRFAGSAQEREAAGRVEEWIRDLGVEDVGLTLFPSRPRMGLVVAVHLAVGALGCVLGGALGALLAGLAAWSFGREVRGGAPVLTRWLPTPASVNVVGRAGARAPRRRVVLSAHIDTAQAGWLFSEGPTRYFTRRAERGHARLRTPVRPHALPRALLVTAALVALAGWLGAEGFLLGTVRVVMVAALVLGCAATLQWATALPTPGANDNASAVAAMLTCGEQLLAQLPDDTELWIVGTGAEEVGCRGMAEFLEEHPDWPQDSTYFVNFECVGGGRLHYIRSEGTLDEVVYPPLMLELARRVADSGMFDEVTPTDLIAGTDGRLPAARGYPALSLITLEGDGVPRNYHRLDDIPQNLDMSTVVRAADFGAAVAWAALRGEAGPIAIL